MTFILAEDAALKKLLQGYTRTYTNDIGETVTYTIPAITVQDEKSSSRTVKVWFGFPDVEIRAQDYPFITIDLIGISQSVQRQHSGQLTDGNMNGTQAIVTDKWYTYDMPVAYDLMYQVTSYARHPRHDRAMMFQLHNRFPALYGRLDVPNELGTSTSRRHMFLESFQKNDRAEGENGNKRLLRNIYTVKVVSEMTPTAAAALTGQPTSVAINKNTSGTWVATDIPDGMYTV
jgi:hypothetical protein